MVVIILLIRWLTYPSAAARNHAGAQIGTYIGLIVAIVQTVFGYLNIVAAGEKLPWQTAHRLNRSSNSDGGPGGSPPGPLRVSPRSSAAGYRARASLAGNV